MEVSLPNESCTACMVMHDFFLLLLPFRLESREKQRRVVRHVTFAGEFSSKWSDSWIRSGTLVNSEPEFMGHSCSFGRDRNDSWRFALRQARRIDVTFNPANVSGNCRTYYYRSLLRRDISPSVRREEICGFLVRFTGRRRRRREAIVRNNN